MARANSPPRVQYPRGWLLIMAAMVAIGPLSIDMYLPSVPTLQTHFGADAAAAQLTLSAYFVGLALGQIFYGPISDRVGRKPPLMFGLMVYIAASIGCIFAPTIEALTLLRFAQALGGSAGMVLTRAMVRDRFPDHMAQILSTLLLVMGLAPILAPLLGGQIFQAFGWQAVFVVLVIYGIGCLLAVKFGLEETQRSQAAPLSVSTVLSGYARLLRHRRFMGYALVGGVAQGGLFAYISGSPFVFIDVYGVAPSHFGWLFGLNAFGLIAASQLNSRLLERFRAERILRRAITAYAVAGAVVVLVAILDIGGLPLLMLPLFVCITSLGFMFPNSTAAAMAPFGDRAGTASALLGTLQFTVAAVAGAAVGQLQNHTAVPMAAVIAVCGATSLALLYLLVPPRS